MNLKPLLKKAIPKVLTVLSIGGVIATAVSASKAGIEAQKLLQEAKESKHDELTEFETVQVAAPAYIPTVIIGAVTIGCIFGVRNFDKRQQAALIGSYALVKRNYEKYKEKVQQILGYDAHDAVMSGISKEKEGVPLSPTKDVHITVPGCLAPESTLDFNLDEPTRLFYDEFSDRYFESTIPKVLEAELHLNRNFNLGMDVTVNDFYDLLGLDHIEDGENLGWYGCDGINWIDFNHHVTTMDDGLEVCAIC